MEPVATITFHTDGSYHINDEYPVNDQEMQTRFGGDRYHLMQFTGIRDKKDNDIYEGDIISFAMTKPGRRESGVVEWCNTCCSGFRVQWMKFGNNDRIAMHNDIEVIGNIYENPELIAAAAATRTQAAEAPQAPRA